MEYTRRCEVYRKGHRVYLDVVGDFPDELAIPAADKFLELITEIDTDLEFVCISKDMRRHQTAGRKRWQDVLLQGKERVKQVTILCDSSLIRMAASAVCLYARIPFRFIDDPDELTAVLRAEDEAKKAS